MEVCTYFLREVKVQWKDNSNLKKINLFPQIMKSLEMESFQIEASSSLSLFFCFVLHVNLYAVYLCVQGQKFSFIMYCIQASCA